jgi:decaprenyl-phosphate phosphoribosyltransferase
MRTAAAPPVVQSPPSNAEVARGLVAACRPRQWLKNLLVVAAPLASGTLSQQSVALRSAAGVACFTLLASGTYLLNDVHDAASDRADPRKRLRPVASGLVPFRLAVPAAVALVAAGVVAGLALGTRFAAISAGYVVLTAGYTFVLRSLAVLDIAAVAGGFVLRAAAGGAVASVHLSPWFLIVTSFGALFVVAGRRSSELEAALRDGREPRPPLAEYSVTYLRSVVTLAATVAVTAYCIWAFGTRPSGRSPWAEISVIPFAIAVLRYGLLVDAGRTASPEDAFLGDPTMLAAAVTWIAVFAAGAFGL